jgi:hypothetical protein
MRADWKRVVRFTWRYLDQLSRAPKLAHLSMFVHRIWVIGFRLPSGRCLGHICRHMGYWQRAAGVGIACAAVRRRKPPMGPEYVEVGWSEITTALLTIGIITFLMLV